MKKLYSILLLFFVFISYSQYTVDFEDASKTSYATGNVTLNGIDWEMADALIATSPTDFFNGAKSARLRGYGTSALTMLSNTPGGIGNITFQYRAYGTDQQLDWKVEYSTDGTNWTQAGTNFTATGSVQTFTATVNTTSDSRIRIVRATADGNTANRRTNIDDITLTTYNGTPVPSLTITSPSNNAIYAPNTTSVQIVLNIANFDVGTTTAGLDGHIHYTVSTNGGTPVLTMKYDTTPINLAVAAGNSYEFYVELVDNSHNPIAPAVNQTINFEVKSITSVSNIAQLRSDYYGDVVAGADKYYEITATNPVITYSRSSRNQKYIQDSSAGILIDDNAGVMPFASGPVTGDALFALIGQVSEFNGVLQFVPLQAATVSSSNNTVTPQVVTAATLATNYEDYESELIQINTATFTTADGTATFATGTTYNLNDGASDIDFRTLFNEANYIGQVIPTAAQNIIVLVSEFNGTPQVVARSIADMPLKTTPFNAIEGLKMYPNPVSGSTLNIVTAANAETNVQIFDILGKEVVKTNVTNNQVNIANLNAGVYIVKVTEEGKTATRKLVVK